DHHSTMSALKAYPGSCHCGNVQYQVRLKFPSRDTPVRPSADMIRLYKCNCSVCQKMGFFHCRPISPADDFILTSPATIEELGDYRANVGKAGWYFCKSCGVRVFGVGAAWEQVELNVEEWASEQHEGKETKLQKVWRTKGTTFATEEDGKEVRKLVHYVSVNAVTLEPSEDIDLRKWHDNGWIGYVENRSRDEVERNRMGKPYSGGMY
ncbi:hypothetical protein P153DRAFT_294862, partial [Dothidotthia symphoricarpi CBS 119687]